MNGDYLCEFLTHLTMNFLFQTTSLLEPEIDIVQMISFLRVFLACLTMIQSHAGLTFCTLFGLSMRVLP
jgi:hypothetical protein